MFRNEDDEMQALGLSPQGRSTPTTVGSAPPVVSQPPMQAASAVTPTEMRPQSPDMVLAQAESPDLSSMSFSPEELGLDEPVDIRGMSFTRAQLGLPEDGLTEPDETLVGFDDQGFPLDPFPPTFGAAAEEGVLMNTPEGVQRVDFSIPEDEQGLRPEVMDRLETQVQENKIPTTDMYDGLTIQESEFLYEKYLENENTTTLILGLGAFFTDPETGQRSFVLEPALKPSFLQRIREVSRKREYSEFLEVFSDPAVLAGQIAQLAFSPVQPAGREMQDTQGVEVGTDTTTKVALSFLSATNNVLELAASIAESTGASVFEGITEKSQTLVPGVATGDSVMDALINEGVPMLAASLVGAGVAYKAMQGASAYARAGATYISAEAAAAAVSRTDSGTFVIGENALFPILSGIDLNDPTTAEEVLTSRINFFIDGLITAGVVGRIASGVKDLTLILFDFLAKPIATALAPGSFLTRAVYEKFTAEIMDVLQLVDKSWRSTDPQKQFKAVQKLAKLIEANENVIIRSLENPAETKTIALDSITAILRAFGDDAPPEFVAGLGGIRTARIQANMPQTIAATEAPARALYRELQGRIEAVGGDTVDDQMRVMLGTADQLAEQGRGPIRQAQQGVRALEEQLDASSSRLLSDIAESGDFSGELRRLADVTGTQVPITRNSTLEQIRKVLEVGYSRMRNIKNELYGKITGGPVDIGAIYDALQAVPIDTLSQQSVLLLRTPTARNLAELLQPRTLPATPSSRARQETREEAIARVESVFKQQPEIYNFGLFYNTLRPELSSAASSLAKNNINAAIAIRDIIKVIDDDMVDYVARQGNPELAGAARAAKEYYANEFAPLFRGGDSMQGPLADYADLFEATVGRTRTTQPSVPRLEAGTPLTPAESSQAVSVPLRPLEDALAPRFRESDFMAGSLNIVERTLLEGNPYRVEDFARIMRRVESGGDPARLADFMAADAIMTEAAIISASGGTEAGLTSFLQKLNTYSAALRQTPELLPRAEELDRFAANVRAVQNDRGALTRQLENATKYLTETKELISTSELSAFLARDLSGSADPALREFATASNPQQAFRKLFALDTNTNARITAIMDRINSALPEQRDMLFQGMETAYVRQLRESVFNTGRESTQLRRLSPTVIAQEQEGLRPLFDVGRIIYRDRPDFMESLTYLADLAMDANFSRNAVPISSMSATAFNQQAATATNRLIFATVGPLTRFGTRIRTALGATVEARAPDVRAREALDSMSANASHFRSLIEAYNREPLSNILQNAIVNSLITSTGRPMLSKGESGEVRAPDFVESAAETELKIRQSVDALGTQMRNIFGD